MDKLQQARIDGAREAAVKAATRRAIWTGFVFGALVGFVGGILVSDARADASNNQIQRIVVALEEIAENTRRR